uniref:N-acetyltransferase domain-containing protein n=1 Tax=Panagrolaimus sp. PS1159 TaxID=55785 RepID=A0AC35FR18_9BILA
MLSRLAQKQFLLYRLTSSSIAAAASQTYKPLQRAEDNFIFDHRKDREILEDKWTPNNTDLKIKFELLDKNIKGNELIELLGPMIKNWIKCENSIIAKADNNKIVGIFMGSLVERYEFCEIYRGALFHDKPKLLLKNDYAEDIRNGPFRSLNLNRIVTLLEELEWQTGKFLPKNTQKLALLEFAAVHPKFMGFGVGTKAAPIMQKIMLNQGCTHEVGYTVSDATYKICLKSGHVPVFSIPYDRFLENGRPIFTNLSDGATAAHTTLRSLRG